MSLQTDRFFINCLRSQSILDTVQGRIFNTDRDNISFEEDKIPYIIVTFDGTTNDQDSKDSGFESDYDHDTVSVFIVSHDRPSLAALATLVRKTIREDIEDMDEENARQYGFSIEDYQFTASPVDYDPDKPCFFQTLTYNCETKNLL